MANRLYNWFKPGNMYRTRSIDIGKPILNKSKTPDGIELSFRFYDAKTGKWIAVLLDQQTIDRIINFIKP